MQTIKMIVTDLDSTLLQEDKTISERTINALKLCREKGIKLAYATGRGNSSKILVPSELFDGFVRVNGAAAYIGDELVHSKYIPIEKSRALLVAAHSAGVKIAAENNGRHYSNFNVIEHWPWIKYCELIDFSTFDIEAEKLYAIDTLDAVDIIRHNLPEDLYLLVSRDKLAMVMHKDAVKSKATFALAERWGIAPDEIAAFGDDCNDVELLENCGIGVAMGNALDEVKAIADYICDDNDNDGMAKWIEENLF